MTPPITLYSIANCEHCQNVKDYLEKRNLAYTCVNVDTLLGQDRNDANNLLSKFSMFPEVPTLVIGDKGVVGDQIDKIEALLTACGVAGA